MSAPLELFDGIAARWLEVIWPAAWQSAVLAGVVFMVTWRLRRGPAALRFWLWMLVPVKLLIMPLVTIGLPLLPAEPVDVSWTASVTPEVVAVGHVIEPTEGAFVPAMTPTSEEQGWISGADTFVPGNSTPIPEERARVSIWVWMMGAWIAGVLFFALKLLRGWRRMGRVVARGREVASREAVGASREAAHMIGLRRAPRVLVTDEAVSPFVSGVVRPVVVLPAALVKQVSSEELLAVLAHEFAHLKRRDPAFGWLLALCEAIYFFHPIMHLAKRRILFERERACDDWVLASGEANRSVYAQAMITAAEVHRALGARTSPVPVVAESFGELSRRLTMIASDVKQAVRLSRRVIILVGILAVVALPGFVLTARSGEGASEEETAANPRRQETTGGVERASEWTARVASGVTAELIGVSYHPSEGQTWWRPDGSVLDKPPYDRVSTEATTGEPYRLYEVAVRLLGVLGEDVHTKYEEGQVHDALAGDARLKDIRVCLVKKPRSQPSANLRLGIAAGEWETLHAFEYNGLGGTAIGGRKSGITVTRPEAGWIKEGIGISIAHTVTDRPTRVIAVDHSGDVHEGKQVSMLGVTGLQQITIGFADLDWPEIKEFRFQARPYEWVEFRNISLRPGERAPLPAESIEEAGEEAEIQKLLGLRISFEVKKPEGDEPPTTVQEVLDEVSLQSGLNIFLHDVLEYEGESLAERPAPVFYLVNVEAGVVLDLLLSPYGYGYETAKGSTIVVVEERGAKIESTATEKDTQKLAKLLALPVSFEVTKPEGDKPAKVFHEALDEISLQTGLSIFLHDVTEYQGESLAERPAPAFYLVDVPANVFLDLLLEPLGFEYRPVDAKTIVVVPKVERKDQIRIRGPATNFVGLWSGTAVDKPGEGISLNDIYLRVSVGAEGRLGGWVSGAFARDGKSRAENLQVKGDTIEFETMHRTGVRMGVTLRQKDGRLIGEGIPIDSDEDACDIELVRTGRRMRHFVKIVVGKEKMTFEGKETTWEELPSLLEKVPEREHTVLTVAVESDEMTLREVNEARSRAGSLSRQFGFEYLSYVGVHPLGSKGDESQEIGEAVLAPARAALPRRIPINEIVERVLSDQTYKVSAAIDFDSGKVFMMPPDEVRENEAEWRGWLKERGVDFLGFVSSGDGFRWGDGIDLAAMVIPNDYWEGDVTEVEVLNGMGLKEVENVPLMELKVARSTSRATYAFRTREGSIGIVRIEADYPHVNLKYRLLAYGEGDKGMEEARKELLWPLMREGRIEAVDKTSHRVTFSLGEFLVNIPFDPTGREQKYLFTEMVVRMTPASEKEASLIVQEMEQLHSVFRDRIVSILRTKEFLEIQNPGSEAKLKQELKGALNKIYEEREGRKDAVEEVLFTRWEIR